MRFTAAQRRLLSETVCHLCKKKGIIKQDWDCPHCFKCGEESMEMGPAAFWGDEPGLKCTNVRCLDPDSGRVKPKLLFYCNDCPGSRGGSCNVTKYGQGQSLTWGEALNAAKHAHGDSGIQILVQYPDSPTNPHHRKANDFVFNFVEQDNPMQQKQFYRTGVFAGCLPGASWYSRSQSSPAPSRVEQFVDRVDALPPFPRVSDNLQFWGDLFRDILATSVNPI